MKGKLRALARFVHVDGLVTLTVAVACGFVPLLAGPGVESALCLGVLVPPFVAGTSAARAARVLGPLAGKLLAEGMRGACLAVLASAILLGRSLLGHACEPWHGLRYLALGPLFGFVLAAIVGVCAAHVIGRPRLAVTAAALVPVTFVLLGGYELYATPGVFLYSPFAGLLPGVLYDPTIELPAPYVTYRALTTFLLGAIGTLASIDGALVRAPRRMAVASALLVLVALGALRGEALGHRASASYIRETLGARAFGERCVLYVPREMHVFERRLHVRDCDFHVASLERWLGVRRTRRAHVYFYRSAEEKRRLMGAADTDVAKPWRGEAHLVREAWPHPVLRHELAHVIAAEASPGPFHVSMHGFIPSPGLIEGLAVAASHESRDGLGPDAWSRAMLELRVLPRMQTLLGLGFLGEAPSTAYVASGSFLAFVHTTQGKDAVRGAYARGGFPPAQLERLERAWHAYLRRVPMPEGALALARVRFERRGMFSAICPHVIARLRGELSLARASGDEPTVRGVCAQILALDPNDASARVARVGALAREGRIAEAARAREALLQDRRLPSPYISAVDLAFADAAVERGEFDRAREAYDALLRAGLTEDALRVIEVKRLALDAPPPERRRILDIVLGRNGLGASSALAVHLGHGLTAMRADGLGPYLVGRQLVNDARFAYAVRVLREAERRGLPTVRLARENARLLALALEGSGECEEAEKRYSALAADAYAGIEASLHRESAAACVRAQARRAAR